MIPGADARSAAAQATSAVLAFALAGVVPDGEEGPRLRHRVAGQGYGPDAAAATDVRMAGGGVRLQFARPEGPIDFIQLEPAAVPGRYRLLRLAIGDAPMVDLGRRLMLAVERLDSPVDGGALSFSSDLDRPAVEFDLRDLEWPDGAVLELVLRRDGDAGPSAGLGELCEHLAAEMVPARAASARMGRELADAADRLAALVNLTAGFGERQAAHAEGLAGHVAGQSRLDAGLQALVEGQGRLDQAQQALAGAVQALDARLLAQDEALAGLAALARAAGSREAADAAHATTLKAVTALQAEVAQVRHAVENVFWRRWMHRLRGGAR